MNIKICDVCMALNKRVQLATHQGSYEGAKRYIIGVCVGHTDYIPEEVKRQNLGSRDAIDQLIRGVIIDSEFNMEEIKTQAITTKRPIYIDFGEKQAVREMLPDDEPE